jgi:hypothetical protein
VNYNGPKVAWMSLCRQREAAPHIGDDMMCSRLYAGKPGVSHRYVHFERDNAAGAENQQERLRPKYG